ncbi:MAG: GGDEF domain-containing protein [Marinobacter sp.]|uniref:GGDEF domain-containing protein n=1 Tax=Marinobacter sp. TaxID=50741 RepID=UPI00396EC856
MAQTADRFLLTRLSRAGFVAFLAITMLSTLLGQPLMAAVSAAAAGVVISGRTFHPARAKQPWPLIQRLFFLTLSLLLLSGFVVGPWTLTHWLYAAPLVTFSLFPPAAAIILTLAVTVLAMAGVWWATGLPDRHQMISAFLLTLLLSGLLVFLREYKSRQLAPLRRTDELTQAASREYLSADLHKEIQRSEREGTDMSVIMIGLDTHLSDNERDEDIRSILPRIGRYLHSQLRDFDTYYRVADLQFLVILPGIGTNNALDRAETIRAGLQTLLESHGMRLTVSTGIAGLNIGDDADSLRQSAAHALRRAQQQGGNRTQVYSAWSRQDHGMAGQERPAS